MEQRCAIAEMTDEILLNSPNGDILFIQMNQYLDVNSSPGMTIPSDKGSY